MKHLKILMISSAVLLLSARPAVVEAQQASSSRHGGHFLKCLSIVGLSDAQKADIKHIFETEKPVLKGLGQTLKTDAETLKAALDHNPPDACTIGADLLVVRTDKEALGAELSKLKSNVEAVLSAEQKAKLEGCLQANQPPVAEAAVSEDDDVPVD